MQERWVLDRLLRAGGLDVLWPDVMGTLLEMGFNHTDITRTMGKVRTMSAMPKLWYQTALHHEARAADELRKGHTLTAAETYHRAVLGLARARWGMFADTAGKVALYQRLNDDYDMVIEHGHGRIERVTAGDCAGLLHLPDGPGPHPAVVLYPGMDMTKEYLPVPGRNVFAERGIAVLALDPPGHGFSALQGIKLTARNVEETGSRAIDLLTARADIDAARVGVFGIGTGGYFGFSLAAQDNRVMAVAGVEGGFFYDNVQMLADEPPSRRARLGYMTGLDGAAFDELMTEVSIAGREKLITCPSMFLVGEWDELTPPAEARRLAEAVSGPIEVRIYEDEGHVLGGVMHEAMRAAVDWLADRFAGRTPVSTVDIVAAYT
ncbi:prolyl oligopeptidase family serine peptidase [Dactylosporangium sp. NPDC050688]|uniref:alpha/beta hydrolase family protein n=1 Tax=Dactylosporangium sp. NPDC050688 TaxID=3157217 RepID=UPI0033E44143